MNLMKGNKNVNMSSLWDHPLIMYAYQGVRNASFSEILST